ncbi:hypothetical protein TSUD_352860 [Trifolium subterraneum]|nr:hypothetical protein TSUD_352860 [Trifolium subterraneum]
MIFDEVFISEEELCLLPKVWKIWALSKVVVFSWQLLQDSLPTRHNLWQRGVITDVDASRCVFCGLGSESADHLFVSCNQISPVWYSILRWLGIQWVSPRGNLGCFEVFLEGTFSAWQRGVITDVDASRCVFCGLGSESADHLFVSCNQISPVWYSILLWLGIQWVSHRGNLGCFEVFLEGTFSAECLIEKVKLLSWKWFLGSS